MALDQLNYFAAATRNGYAPAQGSKALGLWLDFQGANTADQLVDLSLIQSEGKLEFVQSVFVNNVLSGQNFTVTADVTGHQLMIPPSRQAYLPILSPGYKFLCSTGQQAAAGLIQIQFLNFPVPAIVW